ncbi:hypothetical protein WMF28_40715 [Sorangium sp. So ce590]|uniref:hypothetical protein n=1 Tax=Sorangium sp. So ce590 TaxID=3133317 RepID=UPI003F60B08A
MKLNPEAVESLPGELKLNPEAVESLPGELKLNPEAVESLPGELKLDPEAAGRALPWIRVLGRGCEASGRLLTNPSGPFIH